MQNVERRMQNWTVVFILVVFILSGCGDVFFHKPQKARETANVFLNLLYQKGDVENIYELTTDQFRKTYKIKHLDGLREKLNKKFGKIEGLRAESYVLEKEERTIILFYIGISEKQMSYHKVTMVWDDDKGYKVSGLSFSAMPYKRRTKVMFK